MATRSGSTHPYGQALLTLGEKTLNVDIFVDLNLKLVMIDLANIYPMAGKSSFFPISLDTGVYLPFH